MAFTCAAALADCFLTTASTRCPDNFSRAFSPGIVPCGIPLIEVRSITPAKSTAVVRFVRTRRSADGSEDVEESLVATIGFEYVPAPMREEDRMVNPLGFKVTSYRVDPENVGG